ncbi:cupin domain-containing protein [Roseiarcaceae bacterium H3SJ34-1]|uniref:cupin domain-containing protein n=1 Tax=Terripilifer ovatus TaxID=3032367 RepID=UPI003AB9702A|nr:cupin domain-containing protein [Roseiarcaceae bacterium H3SJ34-1]
MHADSKAVGDMALSNLAMFDDRLAQVRLRGQWKSEEFLSHAIGGPKPAGLPAVWQWSLVCEMLEEAGRVIPESLQARRSLIFQNPGLSRGTTHTMNAGIQMIMPGEVAWAHRHSIAALRFIIEGDPSLHTNVDGETCIMEKYDLVLTPNWAWHDHHNLSSKPTFWLDVLDVPLVLGLNQVFYQPGDAETQRQRDQNAAVYSQLRYPWKDVLAALSLAAIDPHDGAQFLYKNQEGGSTLPTLQCMAQLLPAGFTTRTRRRTSSAIYFVVKGSGALQVEGTRYEWGPNDTFAVPNWSEHRLINHSQEDEALMFSVHDMPVLSALGLFRDQRK